MERGLIFRAATRLAAGMRGSLQQLFKPKHSHAELRPALEGVLGSKRFGDSKCRLAIATHGAIGGRVFVMKTAHHERFRYDLDAPAVDVAMATSAAPTCFSATPFPQHANASCVDGGVWANCPVLAGGRLHRMNATARAGEFALDDARPARIDQPLSPGRAHAVQAENLTDVKTRFLNGLTAPEFRPPVSPAQGAATASRIESTRPRHVSTAAERLLRAGRGRLRLGPAGRLMPPIIGAFIQAMATRATA